MTKVPKSKILFSVEVMKSYDTLKKLTGKVVFTIPLKYLKKFIFEDYILIDEDTTWTGKVNSYDFDDMCFSVTNSFGNNSKGFAIIVAEEVKEYLTKQIDELFISPDKLLEDKKPQTKRVSIPKRKLEDWDDSDPFLG